MKTLYKALLLSVLSVSSFSQSVIQNNTTSISITPDGVRTNHPPSNDPTNTALGLDALKLNVGKSNNTAFGANTLKNNSVGSNQSYFSVANSAFGADALMNNTTGFQNSAFGSSALRNNTSGVYNSAFGNGSLSNNTGGGQNTAMGWSALGSNSTAIGNVAIGYATLNSNSIGEYNVAVGREAMKNNISGDFNSAFGSSALLNNVGNNRNTAVGYGAMERADNRSAAGRDTYNTAVGVFALRGSSTASMNIGVNNTAVGDLAMSENKNGSGNVAVGKDALKNNSGGSNNTIIGLSNTSGNNNIYIGYQAGLPDNSNKLVIENSNSDQPLIMGDFANDKLGINRTYSDLIGRGEVFQVTGEAFKTVGTGNWIIPSDRRLKENITYLDSQDMLDKVLKMKGVTFQWKDKSKGQDEVYGFIAQELQTVFPSNVKTDNAGYLSASYGSYDPMLVESIKALKQLIDNQKEVVEVQNQQIHRLEQELTALKKQISSVGTEGQAEGKTKK